jgi:hypothetical protein
VKDGKSEAIKIKTRLGRGRDRLQEGGRGRGKSAERKGFEEGLLLGRDNIKEEIECCLGPTDWSA